MNIGLYIPPELFSLNLKPLELLIAAEILQFGDGKCHARASHFSKRFGRPKRTVLDAIERLRESQIIVEDGQVKRLAVAATNRAENDTNDTEIRAIVDKSARAEKRIDCAENDIDRAENAHECAKNDTRSKVRNKIEETKTETRAEGAHVSPEVQRSAEKFAALRHEKMKLSGKIRPSAVEFYGRMLTKLLEKGEATQVGVDGILRWMETTAAGREAFGFGMVNMSKNYEHSFSRFYAQNLIKARKDLLGEGKAEEKHALEATSSDPTYDQVSDWLNA